MEFFCLKCREKRTVPDSSVTTEDKSGRRLLRATCPNCGTKLAKFGKSA